MGKHVLVARPLLVNQVAQKNSQVVHDLMPLLLVVHIYRLNREGSTLTATGMSKGQYTPRSTTQADPRPSSPPMANFSLEVGSRAGISSPLIFMMPSGPMCRSCLRKRSPSVPISEKTLFSISVTYSQSICRFILRLAPITAKLQYPVQTPHSNQPQDKRKNNEKIQNGQGRIVWEVFWKLQDLFIILLVMESCNPEATALSIMNKSYLKPRDEARQTGSKFFQENKIRSCSFVKETADGFKAVPFYDKRDNTQYPTPSTVTRSWSSNTHNNSRLLHAGMGVTKPLLPYVPNAERSSIRIPDFRPPYPNSSHIQLGERSERDTKHYVTTYNNSFIGNNKWEMPSSHPGIQATRNQWVHSRLRR